MSDRPQQPSPDKKTSATAKPQAGRREPDFDINNLDEAHVGHRERRQRERRQGAGGHRGSRSGRGGLVLSLIALIMLIAVSAVGFLELGALQKKMNKVQASLDDMNLLSGNQFESLKSALDSADKQQTQWGKSVDKQLKVLDSEMRKLWVISHQTNQPRIQKLENDLAALVKTGQQLTAKLKTQAKVIDDQAKTLGVIQETETELKRGVAAIDTVKSRLDEQQIRLDDVPVALEALKLQLAELASQAEASTELLQQLDDYRTQVNRSVDQLTEEIRVLKGGGSQPGL